MARSGPTSSTIPPTGAAITRRPGRRSGGRPTARSTPSSARSPPAGRGKFQVTEAEMMPVIFDLLLHEGLVLGGSTGINVCGAIKVARELGPGHTIVTILADYGTRYQSKLFNPDFLRSKNLPVPEWLAKTQAPA